METQHLPWINTSSQELKRQTWLKIGLSVFTTDEWNTEKNVFKRWLNEFPIHYLTAELTMTFKPHWSHGTDTETNHSQHWSLLSQLHNLLGNHPYSIKNSVEVHELLHISRGLLWELPHCKCHSSCTSSGLICTLPCWLSSPGSSFTIPKVWDISRGSSVLKAIILSHQGSQLLRHFKWYSSPKSCPVFRVLSVAKLSHWKILPNQISTYWETTGVLFTLKRM